MKNDVNESKDRCSLSAAGLVLGLWGEFSRRTWVSYRSRTSSLHNTVLPAPIGVRTAMYRKLKITNATRSLEDRMGTIGGFNIAEAPELSPDWFFLPHTIEHKIKKKKC
jgi:hypothetical protein